jgi:hypothetical protein
MIDPRWNGANRRDLKEPTRRVAGVVETIASRHRAGRSQWRALRLAAAIASLFFACSDSVFGEAERYVYGVKENVPETSIVAVLANPQAFEGKVVDVAGFLAYEPQQESSSLCLSREAYDMGLLINCLYIEPDWAALGISEDDVSKVNFQYVSVQGVVEPASRGHFSMNAAGLTSVRFIFLLEKSWKNARRMAAELVGRSDGGTETGAQE